MSQESIILEEEIDPNYVPTQDEVHEYAKWLGMDLQRDKALFWIAREGLQAPLPAHWKPCKTADTGEIYYFNFSTGDSTWDHPCDEYYRKLFEEERAKAKRQQKMPARTRNAEARRAWKRAVHAVLAAKWLFSKYIERREDELFGDGGGLPGSLVCPITHHLLRQPVVAADGFTYEQEAIKMWFETEGRRAKAVRSPMTNLPLKSRVLTENRAVRTLLDEMLCRARQAFCAAAHQDSPSAATPEMVAGKRLSADGLRKCNIVEGAEEAQRNSLPAAVSGKVNHKGNTEGVEEAYRRLVEENLKLKLELKKKSKALGGAEEKVGMWQERATRESADKEAAQQEVLKWKGAAQNTNTDSVLIPRRRRSLPCLKGQDKLTLRDP